MANYQNKALDSYDPPLSPIDYADAIKYIHLGKLPMVDFAVERVKNIAAKCNYNPEKVIEAYAVSRFPKTFASLKMEIDDLKRENELLRSGKHEWATNSDYAQIINLCKEVAEYKTPSGCVCSMRAGETCSVCSRSEEDRKLEKDAKRLAELILKTEKVAMVQSIYPKANYPTPSIEETKKDIKRLYELVDTKNPTFKEALENAVEIVFLLQKHRETIEVRRSLCELVIKNIALEEEMKQLNKRLNWHKED